MNLDKIIGKTGKCIALGSALAYLATGCASLRFNEEERNAITGYQSATNKIMYLGEGAKIAEEMKLNPEKLTPEQFLSVRIVTKAYLQSLALTAGH